MPYSSNNMKRAKDNTGGGYSYGSAVASLTPLNQKTVANHRKSPNRSLCNYHNISICKIDGMQDDAEVHVLRTTAINDVVTEAETPLVSIYIFII